MVSVPFLYSNQCALHFQLCVNDSSCQCNEHQLKSEAFLIVMNAPKSKVYLILFSLLGRISGRRTFLSIFPTLDQHRDRQMLLPCSRTKRSMPVIQLLRIKLFLRTCVSIQSSPVIAEVGSTRELPNPWR